MQAAKARERWDALGPSDQRERWEEDRGNVGVAGGEGARASRQASEASAGVAGGVAAREPSECIGVRPTGLGWTQLERSPTGVIRKPGR